MSDSESVKKMLRSVLQSSKTGVSVSSLQSEYRSLCGESIPLKKLGYSKLENYLQSIPSVVRMEYRMGEMKCFAAVCRETAHIAELVARQKNSKKSGRSQMVNCKMRFKPSNPYMLNVKPRSSLRQPSRGGASNWMNHSRGNGGFRSCSASGDYRQADQKFSSFTPVEHRQPAFQPAHKPVQRPAHQPAFNQFAVPVRKEKSLANHTPKEKPPEQVSRTNQPQSGVYDVSLVQRRLTQLLQKYSSGLWLSKLLGVYSEMFKQTLPTQVLTDLEEWKHICMVESTCRADRLVYPPLPAKPSTVPRSTTPPSSANTSSVASPVSTRPSSPERPPPALRPAPSLSPKSPLAQPTFIFPPQPAVVPSGKHISSVTLRSPAPNPALAPRLPPCVTAAGDNHKFNPNTRPLAPTWASPVKPGPDILPLLKVTFSPSSDPPPSSPLPPPKPSASPLSAEVRQRVTELLSMYSHGLWSHALPKLFMDTYKEPFPQHLLDNLSLLLDICTVEYPIPHDKKKAILYEVSRGDMDIESVENCISHPLPSGVEVWDGVVPPSLVLPSEQYPSVLITDAKSSNAVTIRYVGENYSNAQEAMEDAMHSFYSQSSQQRPLSSPTVGQLVAVRGEDGDELARAQVIQVMASTKVKVYYVDYGFSVETAGTNLLELHRDFLSLPFQATNVRLAGLEAFSSHPVVLSSLDRLAVGTILLMETLEACRLGETPVAVLYDTSQDDDININSACLKALQDTTMNNPLTVNTTYQDVCVTNVCADGIIYCQLPSRGTARLSKLMEETEALFSSQMTSESLVSRPFTGKFCLARYKGKWSRVEIINMHGNRVMEIVFIDLGVPATVEITDLREIPPVLLKDFTFIPPQAIKCRLADLKVPEVDWSQEAVMWVKEALLSSQDCKIKILKLDQHKGDCLVYMYLFLGDSSQELDKSLNHQLAQSDLWHKLTTQINNNTVARSNNSADTGLSDLVEKMTLSSPFKIPVAQAPTSTLLGAGDSSLPNTTTNNQTERLSMPPPLEFPQPGQNMDVFVPVACHPGYFVLQPWQDLHKLVVLMGEMILYYNQTCKTNADTNIHKGHVYAAKIDKNWHRVQVKGILSNGLVSVYELDYGKHELVRSTLLKPLIEEFRQLPFQAITAQLAGGVTQHQWAEEAAMLFRNHVEGRALVAQVESVQEVSEVKGELWERRLTVYLVDTTSEEKDLWIHSIMADIGGELSSAA